MTNEILNMSKEELINTIARSDELGRKIEITIREMTKARDELYLRADELNLRVRQGTRQMETLATAIAEMRKRLRDDFDCHVI